MTEILLPGTKLYFERSNDLARATQYTVVAAAHRGEIVPLVSVRANRVVKWILKDLYPNADAIVPEWRHGRSRFDFLVTDSSSNTVVEAKSCSLSEYGVAMFPDAPTIRGHRHIVELAELTQRRDTRLSARVIFLITHGKPERFIPHVHTDPDFALSLHEAAEHIDIDAFSVQFDSNGRVVNDVLRVPVDTTLAADLAKRNGGIYLLILSVQACRIQVGGLGEVHFETGFYVYVGSAVRNLKQRISRHLRKRKKNHWHIDYLVSRATKTNAYPIFTYHDLECELARGVRDVASEEIRRFGSSDCDCPSHLFYFESNPLEAKTFVDLLLMYRHRRAF